MCTWPGRMGAACAMSAMLQSPLACALLQYLPATVSYQAAFAGGKGAEGAWVGFLFATWHMSFQHCLPQHGTIPIATKAQSNGCRMRCKPFLKQFCQNNDKTVPLKVSCPSPSCPSPAPHLPAPLLPSSACNPPARHLPATLPPLICLQPSCPCVLQAHCTAGKRCWWWCRCSYCPLPCHLTWMRSIRARVQAQEAQVW